LYDYPVPSNKPYQQPRSVQQRTPDTATNYMTRLQRPSSFVEIAGEAMASSRDGRVVKGR